MARRKSTRWRKPRPKKARKKSARELKIEAAILEWESLSEGLTAQEKLKLARELRGSGVLPIGIRARLVIPTNDMWGKLAKKVTLMIISREGAYRSDRVLIPIRFPFNFRNYLKGFPTGSRVIDVDMLSVTMYYNCCKVLDWLWERGYSRYSSKQLRYQAHVFNKWLAEFDREFTILNNYGFDSEIIDAYAEAINRFEGENNEPELP